AQRAAVRHTSGRRFDTPRPFPPSFDATPCGETIYLSHDERSKAALRTRPLKGVGRGALSTTRRGKPASAACSAPRTGPFTALCSGRDGRGVSAFRRFGWPALATRVDL